MFKKITIASLSIAAVAAYGFACVFFGVASPAQEVPKSPMTVGEAIQVLGALRALDGQQVIVKQNGGDVVVAQPWKFSSATLRLAIADNIAILSKLETSTDKARVGIIREIANGGDRVSVGTKEFDEFQRQYDAMNAAPYGAAGALTRIDAKALNLDVNEIPVTTLSALWPILSR